MVDSPPRKQPVPKLSQRQLVAVLRSLDTGYWVDPSIFNPALLVTVANQLIPQGKAAILRAADEYIRTSKYTDDPSAHNIDMLLLLLFDSSVRRLFRPSFFMPGPFPEMINRDSLPRFPLVVIDDIPVLGARASYVNANHVLYASGEFQGKRRELLNDINRYGVLRTVLLKPPSNPPVVYDKVAISDQWYWCDACRKKAAERPVPVYWFEGAKQEVMHQLLRMVRPVYPTAKRYFQPPNPNLTPDLPKTMTEADWRQCCREVEALNLEWNVETNVYELPEQRNSRKFGAL